LIFDFGRNTQQCAVTFKFDCVGSENVSQLVQHYVIKRTTFKEISRGEGQQVILSSGDGSESNPYYQLRISPGEILLWAGWNAKYELWRQWRDKIFSELFLLLETFPVEYVLAISSQLATVISPGKLRNPDEVPELAPLRTFMGRFLPKEVAGRGNAYVVSSDPEGRETISWWTGPPEGQGEDAVSCSIRSNFIDTKQSLSQNIMAHTKTADELFERFHSGFLSLIIKQ
jgi:hypothetical protein